MHYVISCTDKPDHLDVRLANRPAHVAYVGEHVAHVKLAGPYLSEDGDTMVGSMLIVDFDSREAVERFAANDPYNRAGVFESVTIRPWKQSVPTS